MTRARATPRDCERKIARHLAALEAGVEPGLIAARTSEVQREKRSAEAVLASAPPVPAPLTFEEVIDTLTALHNVPDLLASTQSADRAALYQAIGVCLFYRRSGPVEEVKALVSLGVDLRRVGGGT